MLICHFAKLYAERFLLSVILLIVITLSVILLIVITPSIVMLSVIKLNAVTLIVEAPLNGLSKTKIFWNLMLIENKIFFFHF